MASVDTALVGGRQAASTASPAPAPSAGNGIGFEGVTVAYRGVAVLQDLNLTVEPGEIVAVIGPSGSGKTTALRAVAGFVRPAKGRIRIGERDVTELPPHDRDLGMVVQNYALFPHMRVDENVAFGLRARSAAESLIRERVQECLRMVGMLDYVRRYPRELSGGQQQRVAIARALAIRPSVLLLDEPLSALDAQIRRNMLEELARLHRELPSLTVLYVTHDQTEALTLANRIAIMRGGRLMAYGGSQSLYRHPPNRFAAEFLGRANLLPVNVESLDGGDGLARVRFGETALTAVPHPELPTGQDCLLCVRPHDLRLLPAGEAGANAVPNAVTGRIQSVIWQGEQHNIAFETGGLNLRLVSAPLADPPAPGDLVGVQFAARSATLIPGDARDGDNRA